ncbi:MAG: hypothetical protein CL799_00580 [Chromatiales bacterium]|jgi:hypothetical protein|nr:hypothetical protein [Chromatiales bacterium]
MLIGESKAKWDGAAAMSDVYRSGWDCTKVLETGFLQQTADDDKGRVPKKRLEDRTLKPGQSVAWMPDHAKVDGPAKETWASWQKKVLGGPAAKWRKRKRKG